MKIIFILNDHEALIKGLKSAISRYNFLFRFTRVITVRHPGLGLHPLSSATVYPGKNRAVCHTANCPPVAVTD